MKYCVHRQRTTPPRCRVEPNGTIENRIARILTHCLKPPVDTEYLRYRSSVNTGSSIRPTLLCRSQFQVPRKSSLPIGDIYCTPIDEVCAFRQFLNSTEIYAQRCRDELL